MPSVLEPEHEEPALWFEVCHPMVLVRAEPSTRATVIGSAARLDVVAVAAVEEHNGAPWARLDDREKNSLVGTLTGSVKPATTAWMLIDGASVGLGMLLRPTPVARQPPYRLWSLSHRVYAASLRAKADRVCLVGPPPRVGYERARAAAVRALSSPLDEAARKRAGLPARPQAPSAETHSIARAG